MYYVRFCVCVLACDGFYASRRTQDGPSISGITINLILASSIVHLRMKNDARIEIIRIGRMDERAGTTYLQCGVGR